MRQPTRRIQPPPGARRRGSVLVYSLVLMTLLLGLVSLGMDYAHWQSVKTELQRSADLTARGLLQLNTTWGVGNADSYQSAIGSLNGIDGKYNGGVASNSYQWGTYDPVSGFAYTSPVCTSSTTAVKVTMSRTAATGNPVKLIFPLLTANGRSPVKTTVDAQATAIAYYTTTAQATIGGKADPWLAGVTNGASVSDGDVAPAESPLQVCQVSPGDTITFTNVTPNNGGVSHGDGIPPDGPNGNTGENHTHNDDDPAHESAVQNNIGDINAPIDSLIGVFLTDTTPNAQPAPTATRDYSTQSARDVVASTDIQNQQPFFIGDGKTSGGTTKTYKVPAGCTRLFLGVMDGHQWSNNAGSFGVTINHGAQIKLVK